MAERRMFAKAIVLSDAFLDMPLSTRCLYFTLGMLADDDGFVGSPKSIMRQCGASQDDMLMLIQKRFILAWDNGVIVIKHWRMNNYLQSDRHKQTTYIEELNTLTIDEKGAYTEKQNDMYTECIQTVYTDKDSIDKYSIDNNINNIYISQNNTKSDIDVYIILKDNSRYPINQTYIDELKEAYPKVDVLGEIKKMVAWCEANPRNRKTEAGIKRFITSWLNKCKTTEIDEYVEKIFNVFFSMYPNKRQPELAKPKFTELVSTKDDGNRLYKAFLKYKDDFVKTHSEDEFNKFCPNLASWLENDSRYWLQMVEKEVMNVSK